MQRLRWFTTVFYNEHFKQKKKTISISRIIESHLRVFKICKEKLQDFDKNAAVVSTKPTDGLLSQQFQAEYFGFNAVTILNKQQLNLL